MIKKIQVLKFMLIFPLWLVGIPTLIVVYCLHGGIVGAIQETKEELNKLTECWIRILND